MAKNHLINRTPTTLLGGKTPYKLLFGTAPSLDSLRVLGCLCYVHKSSRDKDKFAERSRKCVFLGYPFGKKGWQLYDLETSEFFISRDIVFQENVFPFSSHTNSQSHEGTNKNTRVIVYGDDVFGDGYALPSTTRTLPATGNNDRGSPVTHESAIDHVVGPKSLPVVESASETVPDTVTEIVTETVTETVTDTVTETVTEAVLVIETLGKGKREKVKSTRLNDYVLYTATCDKKKTTTFFTRIVIVHIRYDSLPHSSLCEM